MPGDDKEGMPVAPTHPVRTAHPLIYEINTWPWLAALSAHHGRPVGLGDVPAADWDAIAALGFDAVWLMGVWERSPAGVAIALANDGLMEEFRATLADFTPDDVVGSPYCVRRYVVDEHLGGPEGLAAARQALADRELGLVLDFVPNHVAPDHPWTRTHAEYFVAGTADDLERDPAAFVAVGDRVLANGKDPYFAAWPDVVQLDAFSPALRAAAIDTLVEIGAQCDGVRCDMAMLMMNATFARTWGDRVGPAPTDDFWPTVIPAVRRTHPAFTFIAEAYWDLEWELQRQHFDFCYDKRLYDRLVALAAGGGGGGGGDAEGVREHLVADIAYQEGLVRFIENHDEPRAASVFPPAAERTVAVAALSQTGARLVHQGQATGQRVHLPVFLGRFPDEPPDADLQAFHRALLTTLADETFHSGTWRLCDVGGWPGDDSWRGLASWCWDGDSRWLVVVNLSGHDATGHVAAPWADVRGRQWRLTDPTHADGATTFDRSGDDLAAGMYVSLPPWQWHFCRVDPLPDPPAEPETP